MKIYEDALKPTDTSLEDDQEVLTQAHDEKAKEIQHDKFLQKVTFFDLELVTDELESFRVQTVKKLYNQAGLLVHDSHFQMLNHIHQHLNAQIHIILSDITNDTATMAKQVAINYIHALHADAKEWMLNPSNQELPDCIIEAMNILRLLPYNVRYKESPAANNSHHGTHDGLIATARMALFVLTNLMVEGLPSSPEDKWKFSHFTTLTSDHTCSCILISDKLCEAFPMFRETASGNGICQLTNLKPREAKRPAYWFPSSEADLDKHVQRFAEYNKQDKISIVLNAQGYTNLGKVLSLGAEFFTGETLPPLFHNPSGKYLISILSIHSNPSTTQSLISRIKVDLSPIRLQNSYQATKIRNSTKLSQKARIASLSLLASLLAPTWLQL